MAVSSVRYLLYNIVHTGLQMGDHLMPWNLNIQTIELFTSRMIDMTRLRRPYTKVLAHSPAHNVLKWHRFFEEIIFFVQLFSANFVQKIGHEFLDYWLYFTKPCLKIIAWKLLKGCARICALIIPWTYIACCGIFSLWKYIF